MTTRAPAVLKIWISPGDCTFENMLFGSIEEKWLVNSKFFIRSRYFRHCWDYSHSHPPIWCIIPLCLLSMCWRQVWRAELVWGLFSYILSCTLFSGRAYTKKRITNENANTNKRPITKKQKVEQKEWNHNHRKFFFTISLLSPGTLCSLQLKKLSF